MKRFRSVVFVAGEERPPAAAFGRAIELSRTNGAALTVVGTVPDLDGLTLGPMGWGDGLYPDLSGIREGLMEERQSWLQELAGEAEAQGLDARARLLQGPLFLETVREVLRGGHDLVMKVAGKEPGRLSRLFASDDHHLLRKCPVPVWLLDPRAPGSFGSVMAAVDVSRDAVGPLNVKILELASSLARREGAELHVVHAWYLYEERYLRAHESEISHGGVRGLLRAEKEERRRRLAELVEAVIPGSGPRLRLRKGRASQVIPAVAREARADILVMGTVARTGIPGLLIGNTAESVLGRVRCGVLAVKPDGFETPVRLPGSPLSGPGGTPAPPS